MSIFAKLRTEELEQSEDRLGGFAVLPTDIYTGTISMAYHSVSQSGAYSLTIALRHGAGEYRETLWVSNAKGDNWFINRNDPSKKVPLPGFTTANDLCLITLEIPLCEVETEPKVINLYNYAEKKDVPTEVQMVMDLIGKEVSLGIKCQKVNKTVKNVSTDKYEPTEETKEENTIDKVFHTESKLTVAEARAGKEVGVFWDAWLTKNQGKTLDKSKEITTMPTSSKSPIATGQTARPSMFGKK